MLIPLVAVPVMLKLIVCVPLPELTAIGPERLMSFPPSVNADAPLLNVNPANVVPAVKSLFRFVVLDVPKNSASSGAGVTDPPPLSQLAAFQKLLAGAVFQVTLTALLFRAIPTVLAAAARIIAVRFVFRISILCLP